MTQFFALREDLLPILAGIESKTPLRYTLSGRYLEPRMKTYLTGSEIPNLCIAERESAINCAAYLVHEPQVPLRLRTVIETDRDNKPIGKSYHLDGHEDSIVLMPGGLWRGEILLYGWVTCSPWANDGAKRMRRRFQSAIRRHFQQIGGYYVAAGAHEMLKAGKRLTIAEQSPRSFDVSLS